MQPPPNVPNTSSMYHHTSQGSLSGIYRFKMLNVLYLFCYLAPPQNNAMPPPMGSYPSPFLVDHGGHMISQPQPPPPPQAYMSMFFLGFFDRKNISLFISKR